MIPKHLPMTNLKGQQAYHFEGVTLLITHFNRSESLRRLLVNFKKLGCSFEDIVVSDDASQPEHLKVISTLQQDFKFRLIGTENNGGLGNNLNKGQDAVKTPYTLYVQEDFVPQKQFPERFKNALQYMDEKPQLDIVRFFAYGPYAYLKPFENGFSEMYIPPFALRYTKIYFYSDHPHLRRSNYFDKFGRYAEGIKGDRTEYKMCISFIQNKGQGLFYDDYQSLFLQVNTDEEPSTMTRENWRMSNNPLIGIVRDVYRQLRYNFDIQFVRQKQ